MIDFKEYLVVVLSLGLVICFFTMLFYKSLADKLEVEVNHLNNLNADNKAFYEDYIRTLKESHTKELEGAAGKKKDSLELQEFLQDLLSNKAVIEVRRVAPTDFFLRRPQ